MVTLDLTATERRDLEVMRDTDPLPYRRERAAALLKIADGQSPTAVARTGLLRRRQYHTVVGWLKRYQAEGLAGLSIRPGRGRKPAFSPSLPDRRRRPDHPVPPAGARPLAGRHRPQPVATG